jgi:potassium channel subfamily K
MALYSKPACKRILSPATKLLVVFLYLTLGVLFYHVGNTVHKRCTDETIAGECGVPDASTVHEDAAFVQCSLTCTESWTVIDALYFSMVTMSTVGFGDLTPGDSWGARLFTCIFIITGIAGPFLIISIELGWVLNRLESSFRTAVMKGSASVAVDLDGDGNIDYEEPPNAVRYYLGGFSFWIVIIMSMNLLSAAIYTLADPSMGYSNALYLCWVTATTVGFGDVGIVTQSARVWSCIHIAVSVGTLGAFIGKAGALQADRHKQLQRVKLLKKKLDKDLICSLDQEGNGVDKFEFVIGMLVRLEMVQWSDVEPFIAQFETMDVDGSGRLTERDLAAMVATLAAKVGAKTPKSGKLSLPRPTISSRFARVAPAGQSTELTLKKEYQHVSRGSVARSSTGSATDHLASPLGSSAARVGEMIRDGSPGRYPSPTKHSRFESPLRVMTPASPQKSVGRSDNSCSQQQRALAQEAYPFAGGFDGHLTLPPSPMPTPLGVSSTPAPSHSREHFAHVANGRSSADDGVHSAPRLPPISGSAGVGAHHGIGAHESRLPTFSFRPRLSATAGNLPMTSPSHFQPSHGLQRPPAPPY